MTVLTLQPSGASGIDTFIDAGSQSANYGTATFLKTAGPASTQKILIKFDLSSIPTGATINSATLTLTCDTHNTTVDITVHRSLVEWFEGNSSGGTPSGDASTWQYRNVNGTVSWSGGIGGVSGTEYVATATDTTNVAATGDHSWDVATDVQDFVDGTYPNHGWWILQSTGINNFWRSSDHAISGDRPKLVIDYTEVGGQTVIPTPASLVAVTASPSVLSSAVVGHTLSITSLEDTYIFAGEPTWNYGDMITLVAGGWSAPNYYNNKSLIYADLSGIPAGAVIKSATLRLYCLAEESSGDYAVEIHRGLVEFFEGSKSGSPPDAGENASTWNHRNTNGSVSWSGGQGGSAGVEYEATASSSVTVTNTAEFYYLTVTQDVEDFVDGTYTNYGWWLTGVTAAEAAKIFYSSKNAGGTGPVLEVVYTISETLTPDPATLVAGATGPSQITAGFTFDSLTPASLVTVAVGESAVQGSVLLVPDPIDLITATTYGAAIQGDAVLVPGWADLVTTTVFEDLIIDREVEASGPAIAYGYTVGEVLTIRPEPVENCDLPLLYLTDGTVKDNGQNNWLSFLSRKNGYILDAWRPAIAQYKDGGYFSDSAIAPGRVLQQRVFGNAIEVFELKARSYSQDLLIQFLQDLMHWQEQVADYWTSTWSAVPVYLVAKSANETNTRYAIVHAISVPDLDNPYRQPFYDRNRSAMEQIVVRIERGHWTSLPPGKMEQVPIENTRTWSFGSWSTISEDPTGTVTAIVEMSDGTLIAGTDDTAKIFRSDDGGSTWTLVETLGTDPADIVEQIIIGHDNRLVAAASGSEDASGIWYSTDTGDTWTKWFTPPAPSPSGTPSTGSLVAQPGPSNGTDTYIQASLPDRNHGVTAMISAGRYLGSEYKGLLRFDLSGIPPNATITSAKISMYCFNEITSVNQNVAFHKALTQWHEGLQMGGLPPQPGENGSTWNYRNHNGSVAWAGGAGGGPGSDYEATATDTVSVTSTGSWFEWDLTADVQDFIDGTSPNYGWWILGGADANGLKQFYSSDWTAFAPNVSPKIVVTWEVSFPTNVGYYGIAFSSTLNEYLAGGGAANSNGVISRTMFWNNTPNYNNWYHTQHTDGEKFLTTLLPPVSSLGIPETFMVASTRDPSFALIRSPVDAFHAPPSLTTDFATVQSSMEAPATAIDANYSNTAGYVLVATSDGKLWRGEPIAPGATASPSNAWRSLSEIYEFDGAVTALYIPKATSNPTSDPGLTVYAAVGTDIYKSENGGYTWTSLTTFASTGVESFWQTSSLLLAGIDGEIIGYRSMGTVEYGQDATTEDRVYVSNQLSLANLTNVKRYDASITTYTNLQFEYEPPYQLFPVVPAAGDIAYFGVDSSSSSSPFSSIVFDIDTPSIGLSEVVWEYWDGSAWSTLTVVDNTQKFTRLGSNSIHWVNPTGWASTTVDGTAAWWVRARIAAVTGSPATPVVGSRYLYTANMPYVEISGSQIRGELPALGRITWQNFSDTSASALGNQVDRAICGLRSVYRGENFNAFLNISDEQIPFGFSLTVHDDGAWQSSNQVPTGRYLQISHDTSGDLNTWNDLISFQLSTTIAKEYYGHYRAFIRTHKPVSGGTVWRLRLKVNFGSGGGSSSTKSAFVTALGDWEVLDLGHISVPTAQIAQLGSSVADQLDLIVQGYCTATGAALNLYDLILIPVDEWGVDATAPDLTTTVTTEIAGGHFLDIDSISNPKSLISSLNRNSAEQIVSLYQSINNGQVILQRGLNQRLWFLFMSYESYWRAVPTIAGEVRVSKSQRYLTLRGNN